MLCTSNFVHTLLFIITAIVTGVVSCSRDIIVAVVVEIIIHSGNHLMLCKSYFVHKKLLNFKNIKIQLIMEQKL